MITFLIVGLILGYGTLSYLIGHRHGRTDEAARLNRDLRSVRNTNGARR